jgi:amino acid transporter
MSETALGVSMEWFIPSVTIAAVFLATAVIPTAWFVFRRKNLDRLVRLWYPIATVFAVVSGILTISNTWDVKLILIGVLSPFAALGSYLGYLLYSFLKRNTPH